MDLDALYSKLTLKTNAKLALVVLDGLGDIATRLLAENDRVPWRVLRYGCNPTQPSAHAFCVRLMETE